MSEPKQVNFTIVPEDDDTTARVYANFCAVAHTPFDFTLTFCEVLPLSERDLKAADTDHVVRAPVKVKLVVPPQFLPSLVAALQENLRIYSESYSNVGWSKGPVH